MKHFQYTIFAVFISPPPLSDKKASIRKLRKFVARSRKRTPEITPALRRRVLSIGAKARRKSARRCLILTE
jgi:hypothetical protein